MTFKRRVFLLTVVAWLSVAARGQQPATGSTTTPAPAPQSVATPSSELTRFLGRTIEAIEIEHVPAEEIDLVRDALPLKKGERLSRIKLREALQSLYSTGRFQQIEAQAEARGANGVALHFSTVRNYFLGAIHVTGAPGPPSGNQLANAIKLELGEAFDQRKVDAGLERMKRIMEDNGYYQSTLSASFRESPETQQIDIHVLVERGPHARVGEVKVTGNPGFTEARVRDIAKMHTGDKVSTARVARALNRLRKKYQKEKRLEAQVTITERKYHPDTNLLDYTFQIERGTKVEVRVEGASLRQGQIKKYVPIYEENAVDDDLLNEARRNLRDYFQTKGFFGVEVDFIHNQPKPGEDLRIVLFDIKRGERHKLKELVINGNKYFDDDTLRERMVVTPASLLLYYGRFSQSLLTRDMQSIENLYKANGFQQVKVTGNVEGDVNGEKGRMRVTVTVEEGKQTLVQKLSIEGNNSYPREVVEGLISTAEGQPYSDYNLASDRDSIINFYYNRGFPDIKFEAFADFVPGTEDRVNVRFQIEEGEQQFVNKVLVSGLENTRRFVVDRELQVEDGKSLSQNDMLETQRRLYDLSIFNEVNVAVQNPAGSSKVKNVLVQTEEAKRYTFNYGLGFEVQTGDIPGNCSSSTSGPGGACLPQGRMGVSPRVSFDVTRLNFMGRNHTLIFKSRLGRLQQRALFSYEAPRWFGRENMTLTFTSFFDKTQDVRTFTAERLEGSAQVRQILDKATTLLYRLTYRRVSVDPTTLQVDPNLIPLLSKPVRVGMPSFTWIRDTRDDPLDSRRGSYNTADLGVASGIFGSESSFMRLLYQNSSYRSFKKKRWVFARSTRVGIEKPFGSVSNRFVPLPERFFAGGGNSHRGFAINQAGPRDLQTGFPLGGQALLVNNLEIRTPPIVLPFVNDNLSAVLFHDAGNVFSNVGEIFRSALRIKQKNESSCRDITPTATCDFNYFSHAIGAGLRYKTPIGPVRVDIGYNLNPTSFAVRTPAAQARPETLKRFNFFFSIGQTF